MCTIDAFVDPVKLRGPAQPTAPDKGAHGRARRGMTEVGGLCGLRPQGPLEDEPDGALGQTGLAEGDALAGQRLHKRPFGAF